MGENFLLTETEANKLIETLDFRLDNDEYLSDAEANTIFELKRFLISTRIRKFGF